MTLVRSLIGWPDKQRKIVAALGFHRTNSTVEVVDTPTIRGMVRKITHLISIESLV
ncbi:MAG: 50S ribosomal protein L30 [Vampirovibrionales bacterium]|nr:50S ribosomal protein L30 [Vampirovibrionales bacterium]